MAGEFLAPKTLIEKLGVLNTMKSVLSLNETPSALERLISAGSKLKVSYQKTCKWKVYP